MTRKLSIGTAIPMAMTMALVMLVGSAPAEEGGPGAATRPATNPKPMMKEYDHPADPRLGTLPEGVGVAVGERAPDVELRDADGHPAKLLAGLERGPVLVVFYRGGWCPFCNAQIHDLVTAYPELEKRGVSLVAVSVDRVDEASKIRATYTIPFPVLSDPDLQAIHAYRVAHAVEDAERTKLAGFGVDLEQWSGREHHVIAIPSLFLVDRGGIVRWGHADPDYKVRPSTAQILGAIDRVGRPAHGG